MAEGNSPRDASTVILTRDGRQGMLEVFLMRRHREQAFMGGAFVFPGGSVDPGDSNPELASYIVGPKGVDAATCLQEPGLPPAIASGLYMAAIRGDLRRIGHSHGI